MRVISDLRPRFDLSDDAQAKGVPIHLPEGLWERYLAALEEWESVQEMIRDAIRAEPPLVEGFRANG